MAQSQRQADPGTFRPAFAPGVVAGLASFAGWLGGGWAVTAQFVVTIMVLIMAVYAVRGAPKWTLLPLLALAVLWNPLWPVRDLITLAGVNLALLFAVPIGVLVIGAIIRVPLPHEPQRAARTRS